MAGVPAPRASPAPPEGPVPFQEKQKQSNFKYYLYRLLGETRPDPHTLADYAPYYQTFQLPAPGPWNGLGRVYQGLGRPSNVRPQTVNYPWVDRHGNIPPPGATPQPVIAARTRIEKQLGRYMLLKSGPKDGNLGWGGNGVALWFHTRPEPTRRRREFVAKANHAVGGAEAIKNEITTTSKFCNAMHIVQVLTPPVVRIRRSPRLNNPPPPDPPDSIDGVMLLEYCHRGSLHKGLCRLYEKKRAGQPDLAFPDRMLWNMFHCLVKSCIAMAYPPPQHSNLYWKPGQVPPCRERIPPGVPKNQFIHFDIDPNNVLVGETDAATGHPVIPVLKLSDFGIGRNVAGMLGHRRAILDYRDLAKAYFFAPEQFSEEWDHLPSGFGPRNIPVRPNVAGHFGWRTNLFQIGLVMACLITGHYPPLPPYPQRIRIPPITIHDLDDDDEYTDSEDEDGANRHPLLPRQHKPPHDPRGDAFADAPNPDPDDALDSHPVPAGWIRVWSYGGYLLDDGNAEYRRVDRELRLLVAQCLCDDPYYRPRMHALDDKVGRLIRGKGWPAEGDCGPPGGGPDGGDSGPGGGGGPRDDQTDTMMDEFLLTVFGQPAPSWRTRYKRKAPPAGAEPRRPKKKKAVAKKKATKKK